MYGLKKPSKINESGKIKGAGTGISDEIKKTVPSGSYIMPKDSTDAIGEENLARLGQPTDVNLSNGEFQLSPDQVHSVGVQALDEMKGQTHAPVDQPQLGIKRGADKPELFFANGGVVDDNFIKPIAGKSPQQSNANRNFGQNMIAPDFIQANKGRSLNANTIPPRIAEQTSSPIQPKVAQQSVSPPPTKAPQNTPSQNSGFGAFAKNMIAPEHDDGSWNAVGGLMNTATGLGKAGVGAAGGLMGGLAEGARGLVGWMADGDNSDSGNIVGPSFDFAADGLKQAKLGVRQAFARSPNAQTETPTSTSQSVPTANKTVVPATDKQPVLAPAATTTTTTADQKPVGTATQFQPNADMFDLNQGSTNQAKIHPNPYAIQQNGNSFSYANAGAAAQARNNGVPELQNSSGVGGIRRANDPNGIANFMGNTREMGASEQQIQDALNKRLGMPGYGGVVNQPQAPQRTEAQEAERREIMRAASTPYAGARNGQLTAAQIRVQADMNQGDANRENDVYKTDANNAANIEQTGMREAGQTGRTALEQQSANWRTSAGLDVDTQKFNATNDLANRQFSEDQLKNMPTRMKQAYELNIMKQYDAAKTPEERQSASERLSMLRGQQSQQNGKDRFMAVGGGQQWDDKAGGTLTQPQRLFDTQTQQFLDTSNQTQKQNIPQGAIDVLKSDPKRAAEFDSKYGQGSSAQYLKG